MNIFEVKEEVTPRACEDFSSKVIKMKPMKAVTYRTKSAMRKLGIVNDQISPLKIKTPRIEFLTSNNKNRTTSSYVTLNQEKKMFWSKIIKLVGLYIHLLDQQTWWEVVSTVLQTDGLRKHFRICKTSRSYWRRPQTEGN